jgi:salicylate hydroxylase
MAQGACTSLEDGVVLAACLRQHGAKKVPQALQEYEQIRRPRVTKIQSRARAAGLSYTEADPVKIRARNGTMRGLRQIDPFATTTWGWVYGYDATNAGLSASETVFSQQLPNSDNQADLLSLEALNIWKDIFTPEDQARGIPGMREGYDRLWARYRPKATTKIERIAHKTMQADLVTPLGCARAPVVLHVHGGGFAFGSSNSSLEYAERMAAAIGGSALVLDYKLAPEHPFPSALVEARDAHEWLLREGIDAADIFLSGESAGAGLALAFCMELRNEGRAIPAGLFALSPMVDLTLSGASIDAPECMDPVIDRDSLTGMAAGYFQSESPLNWRISPLFGDFSGLPPILIQAGNREKLVSDSTRMAERAQAAGCNVTLSLYDARLHVFSLFPFLPAAEKALLELKEFASNCRSK